MSIQIFSPLTVNKNSSKVITAAEESSSPPTGKQEEGKKRGVRDEAGRGGENLETDDFSGCDVNVEASECWNLNIQMLQKEEKSCRKWKTCTAAARREEWMWGYRQKSKKKSSSKQDKDVGKSTESQKRNKG